MPSHWGKPQLHIVERSSTAGMQWLQAVGAAEASLYFAEVPKALEQARPRPWANTWTTTAMKSSMVSGGEGMTSEGRIFRGAQHRLHPASPGLFLVEDNGYAISVPVEVQTAGRQHFQGGERFPRSAHRGVRRHRPACQLQSHARAAEYCRARKGPALVHAHVTRPYSHSLSDDEKLYKRPE